MNKPVGQIIANVCVSAGIAVVMATASANPLTTSKATSEFIVGTIAPAERAVAVQPAAPDVKFEPTTSSHATQPTQPANQATPDGTSQAANQAANRAADQAANHACPGGCGRTAPPQAATQAANQAANRAADQAANHSCPGGCSRTAPPQAATQAANQSANQAATLGPTSHPW